MQDTIGVAPAVDDIRSTCSRNDEEPCCQNNQYFPHGNPPIFMTVRSCQELSYITTPTGMTYLTKSGRKSLGDV